MVALVFCGDLRYCPYINRYIERLETADIDYKVYFWNRSKYNLELSDRYIYFDEGSALTSGKLQKILDFVKFRKWVLEQLKNSGCEKVIALSTLTGVLLGKFLYKGNVEYVFDIRDYSYEHIKPFFVIEEKIIANSNFTAISSPGFREFLPSHQYVIAHNFNRKEIVPDVHMNKTDGVINFVWNGMVRFFEFQRFYLDALKNDPRFHIVFHGDGPELDQFKEYCDSNLFTNVEFTGAYNNSEKRQLLANAHILNNCYGYTHGVGNKLKYAVSNRFYDGIVYHIPQLVEPEGFKPSWANKFGLGVSFPPDADFVDKLYAYYKNIDVSEFDNNCNKQLKRVLQEDFLYIEKIDKFIK